MRDDGRQRKGGEQRPRLGERADLRIEVLPSAVLSYCQSYAMAFASADDRALRARTVTEAEAREDLTDALPLAHVTLSTGDAMRVRARVRRLQVDVQAELTRVSPTHVRCHLATVRRLNTRTTASQRERDRGGESARVVYSRPEPGSGRRKMGLLRAIGGRIEYRPVAESNGEAAPPWGPLPEHVRVLATRDDGLATWLAKYGVK